MNARLRNTGPTCPQRLDVIPCDAVSAVAISATLNNSTDLLANFSLTPVIPNSYNRYPKLAHDPPRGKFLPYGS